MASPAGFIQPTFKLLPDQNCLSGGSKSDQIRSVLDLIRHNEIHNPKHTFCLQELKAHDTLCLVTFEMLAEAIKQCVDWLEKLQLLHQSRPHGTETEGKPRPVALLMGSDIGIFFHIAALMWMEIPVALFSARLTPVAIAQLLERTSACSIIVTSHTARTANEAISLLAKSTLTVDCIQAQPVESILESAHPSGEAPIVIPEVHDSDRNVLILHSSGTTGLPKPIYHTHKYLLGYAACHRFPPNSEVDEVCASTLPLFHGFGLLAPCLSLAIGKPFCLPSSSNIPTAGSTVALIQKAKATSLMTVPSILEELLHYPEEKSVQSLLGMKFVACGGGPMKGSVAEELAGKGVRLLNHCGATEIGAIAPIFNPDPEYDWRYFLLRDDIGLRVEPIDGHSGRVKLVGRPFGWDEDFTLQDFLRPNPEVPSQFQFLGRADDLIVLANGEKVRPTALEETVSNDYRIKDAIVFGESRDHLGLIVETVSSNSIDGIQAYHTSTFIDDIWPVVQAGNELIDKHGKISKDMVIVTTPSTQPLIRTSKGSLARKDIYEAFATQIEAAYMSSAIDAVDALPEANETGQMSRYVRDAVYRVMRIPPESDLIADDDDFFEQGMDSLQATMLRRILLASIARPDEALKGKERISREFVYVNSSINRICYALSLPLKDQVLTMNHTSSRVANMKEMVHKYSRLIEAQTNGHEDKYMEDSTHSSTIAKALNEKIVLLTGSTGSVGSLLLHNIAIDPAVCKIICLNRRLNGVSSHEDPQIRQKRANEKSGAWISEEAWKKVILFEVDYTHPTFGLSSEEYATLTEASHIIHNAWPMNFNRSLRSFEAHFQAICNIVSLGLQCPKPRIIFASSIAVVARYGAEKGEAVVPELPIDDPSVTAHFGYPEAKWVCEQLLQCAAISHPSKFEEISVVRIGQLVGSSYTGAWSPLEHLPSSFKSSLTIGALPDLPHTLSWLPVDTAAKAMIELTFRQISTSLPSKTSPLSVFHIENPNRQPWSSMLSILQEVLARRTDSSTSDFDNQVRQDGILAPHNVLPTIPFQSWLALVREHPHDDKTETNPAKAIEQFMAEEFIALATGGVVLETEAARAQAPTLANATQVGKEELEKYVKYWRKLGFM